MASAPLMPLATEEPEQMKLVRFPDLSERYGLTFSRQHIGRLRRSGHFPEPVKFGLRSVAWLESDIVGYIAAAAAQRPAQV